MKETLESIIAWHRETFPDETQLGQWEKFREEKIEWEQSKHITDDGLIVGDITELADCFIVCCGLARFNNLEALYAFRTVAAELENSIYATVDLEEAVDAKMAINRGRTWTHNGGHYKHKED